MKFILRRNRIEQILQITLANAAFFIPDHHDQSYGFGLRWHGRATASFNLN